MALILYPPSSTSAVYPFLPPILKLRINNTQHFSSSYPRKISALPQQISSTFIPNSSSSSLDYFTSTNDITIDWGEGKDDVEWGAEKGEEEKFLRDSPWEGALIYKRDASVTHLEYCTTLERLGLGRVSSEVSTSKASTMGLRVTKAVKNFPEGTPVLVSVDVCRKRNKIRLDGIIRTVLSLGCNRCGKPCGECVFSNFTLLLEEEPIEETDVINLGTIFGEDRRKGSDNAESGEDDDDEALIDLDDRLHFPAEEKEIDISKNIRDLVHVEITITAICDSKCKGLCLGCGENLNVSGCHCKKQDIEEKNYGPLRNLKAQMQKNK